MTPLSGQPFNAKVGVLTELSGECVHFSEQGLGYLHSKGKMHRDIKVRILFICLLLFFSSNLTQPRRTYCAQLGSRLRASSFLRGP